MTSASTGIPETLQALTVPLADLKAYPSNPRVGNVDVIVESLRVNGQYRPIVARRGTGEVLAGNHTLQAARKLGWPEIAVTWVECTDEEAARIVLVDNRSNDLAGYDDTLLAGLLQDLPALDGTGYDGAFLDELLAGLVEPPEPDGDPDDAPPVPAEPVSVVGDLWLLGPHRLVCGDSTDRAVLERVMDGRLADAVWTDPPYGVSYQTDLTPAEARRLNRRTDGLEVRNDSLTEEGLQDFLRAALGAAHEKSKPGACWYVAAPSGQQFADFGIVLRELDVWRQTLVWVKDRFAFGRSDYHYRHESIFYGWKAGAAHHAVPSRDQDTVWEFPRPGRSPEHPTMKPVALIERALLNSSRPGAVVLDPFGGSGSTLVACHLQQRKARLVELDPRYADVICRRYQQVTGDVPVRDGHGPVDFLPGPHTPGSAA